MQVPAGEPSSTKVELTSVAEWRIVLLRCGAIRLWAFVVRPEAVLRSNRRCSVGWCTVLFMKSDPGKSATERLLLSVVDDDEMLRESLPELLREFGFAARSFSSGQEFLCSEDVKETRCLILDVAMPEMSGLDLQEELKRRGQLIPIIFITGQRDEHIRKQALGQGAVKFLYKPFSDDALLDAVNAALSGE